MVKPRFILSTVAFGVSFGISLLTSRDLGRATLTGLISIPAALAASVVVDRRYPYQAEMRIAELQSHIQALQVRRAEAYQSLLEVVAERDRMAASFPLLQVGGQLQLPAAAPATQLLSSRKQISWNLSASKSASPMEAQVVRRESAAQRPLKTQIQTLERQEANLNQALTATEVVKQQLDADILSLEQQCDRLQTQVAEQRHTKQELHQEIVALKEQRQKLEIETRNLQIQIHDLEQYKEELNHFLLATEPKRQQIETKSHSLQAAVKEMQVQVNSLSGELNQLETQVIERRREKAALETELAVLKAQTSQLTSDARYAVVTNSQPNGNHGHRGTGIANGMSASHVATQTSPVHPADLELPAEVLLVNASEILAKHGNSKATTTPSTTAASSLANLPGEWTEFMVQLPEFEFQVLKAITEQNNSAAAIRKIAEAQLTMPELLIDAINDRALATIGDIIIEPGSSAGTATVAEEHLPAVKQVIKTYEYLIH